MQNHISMRRRGWSGQKPSLALFGFVIFLFWFLSQAHKSHKGQFKDLYVIQRVFTQGCAFLGLHCYCSPFRGWNSPKTILGAWIDLHSQSAIKISGISLSKMADGRHLEKLKNRHISSSIWPILTKFGVAMHLGPTHQSGCYKCTILKIPYMSDVLWIL